MGRVPGGGPVIPPGPDPEGLVFCGDFDAWVARSGPAAVFVQTIEGDWRVEPDLSRFAWGRVGAERLGNSTGIWHALVRDRATGFVSWWLVSHPALLEDHPRVEATLFKSEAEARAALAVENSEDNK